MKIVLLFLFTTPTWADSLGLIINGKAIHLDDQEWNEKNWGSGLQYEFDSEGPWRPFISVSGFIDSNRNNSYYAGGGYKRRIESLSSHDERFRTEVGAIAFLMTRKDYRGNHPFLGLLPVLTVGSGALDLNITYIPDVAPKLVPLLFFQAVYKFELP